MYKVNIPQFDLYYIIINMEQYLDVVKFTDDEIESIWNGALVNFYEDGSQYIGAHSDSLVGA